MTEQLFIEDQGKAIERWGVGRTLVLSGVAAVIVTWIVTGGPSGEVVHASFPVPLFYWRFGVLWSALAGAAFFLKREHTPLVPGGSQESPPPQASQPTGERIEQNPNPPEALPIPFPAPVPLTPAPRLSVELVPETCWFSNVRSEVSAKDWERLKRLTSEKANARCEVCGGRGHKWPVECHEIWHYDDDRHVQTLRGLVALCPSCHEVKHLGLANKRGRRDQALEHLARVNGWTAGDTTRYLDAQFTLWEERSRHEWELDISWLMQSFPDLNLVTLSSARRRAGQTKLVSVQK